MDRYSFIFTGAGYAYTRQVLGQRPHDEVRPLIDSLEMQKAGQEQPAKASPARVSASSMPPRPRRGRPPSVKPAVSNGNGAPHDAGGTV
jgi:hypothetical protein